MAGETAKKPRKRGKFLVLLVIILIALPLGYIALALIGRINPGDVIPDSYGVYLRIPDPVRLADGFLHHEILPEILAYPDLAPAVPLVRTLENSPVLKKPLFRFFLRGRLEGALLGEKQLLLAWDSGLLSPLLRFLPALTRYITIPGLYFVQAGKNSRFEFRPEKGDTFYIGPWHNLLIISNDPQFFETVLAGRARDGDLRGSGEKTIQAKNYDAALLVSPDLLRGILSRQEQRIAGVLRDIDFPTPVEISLSPSSKKLDIHVSAPISSPAPALRELLEGKSPFPNLSGLLPASAQYSTILSAGTLRELYDAAAVFSGPELGAGIKQADSSSRLALGISLEDLLFSWTGTEFAAFGMEGRPNPVYVVQIADEQKRQQIFDRAFQTVLVNENLRLNLDGVRIPRIELPEFLRTFLQFWNIRVPSPYYTVHKEYLFVSESAETLLAAIRAIQRNETLPKTAVWRELAKSGSDRSSFSLFYSLDASLPFFLKGQTTLSAVLGLYRQGLLRLSFEQGQAALALSVIPGSGGGLSPIPGYPLDLGGKAGNQVYGISAAGASRLFLTRNRSALALNPQDKVFAELDAGAAPLWCIPAEGSKSRNGGLAWVTGSQGRVSLVNENMEPLEGFPINTGLSLSAIPAAQGGNLFLYDREGAVYEIDSQGGVNSWETRFDAALRSPPSFLSLRSGRTYAAVYPKSFFLSEIWLLDAAGKALPNWPAPVSGIAFGSPLLFLKNNQVRIAFITQAGELSVFDEKAAPQPPFPLDLEGIFFIQPVFDGEFLWLVSSDGVLYQISLDGTVLRQRIPHLFVREEGYIGVQDVDGDRIPEVFVSGEGNALYGYARNFSSLNGFPLPIWGRPFFGDLNGDGKMECAGVGLDNKLYRWQFK
jgi:outer membrane protein assembly factor BamB